MEKPMMQLVDALMAADRLGAQSIVDGATEDLPPIGVVENLIVPALEFLGRGWEKGDLALSQVYMGGRICERMVDALMPPASPDRKDQPRMAVCVLQDHHMLGKQIVYSLLRAGGFELTDYGYMTVDAVVRRVVEDRIKVLLISVLMLPSALQIQQVTAALQKTAPDTKVVVGGAPFTFDGQLWQEVGAHAVCTSASDVVPVIEKIMKG